MTLALLHATRMLAVNRALIEVHGLLGELVSVKDVAAANHFASFKSYKQFASIKPNTEKAVLQVVLQQKSRLESCLLPAHCVILEIIPLFSKKIRHNLCAVFGVLRDLNSRRGRRQHLRQAFQSTSTKYVVILLYMLKATLHACR